MNVTQLDDRRVLVWEDDERKPLTMDRVKTLHRMFELQAALHSVTEILDDMPEDLSVILRREVFDNCNMDCSSIDRLASEMEYVMDKFTDPEPYRAIPPDTLEDLGYTSNIPEVYEKLLHRSTTQEVTEEIIVCEHPVRRQRTIIWDEKDGVKSSTAIKYKKLPIGKKLSEAIKATLEAQHD